MANKYQYNHTFEDKRIEEDREVYNDYLRQKTSYYETLDEINYIIYQVLMEMTVDEVKEAIKNTPLISPVARIK